MKKIFSLLLVAGLFISGCAGHIPINATPQMRIAIYADDAMKSVREVQRLTMVLESTHVIRTVDAAQVMIVAEKIGQGGVALSRALSVYDGASDLVAKRLALVDVIKTLDRMDVDLKALLAPLDVSGQKLKYIDTVTAIIKSLWSVRVMLPESA